MAAAEKMAAGIAKNAPIAVRNCKKAINDGLEAGMDDAIVIEEKLFGDCFENTALSEQILISQLMEISQPPPSAKPFTAAMTGKLEIFNRGSGSDVPDSQTEKGAWL